MSIQEYITGYIQENGPSKASEMSLATREIANYRIVEAIPFMLKMGRLKVEQSECGIEVYDLPEVSSE